MTSRKREDAPNLRTDVRRAAAEANVAVNEYERAIVLGQVAELLALHPQIGSRIAFKGGAVMTLFDGSPRLSRDLDAVLVSGGRITEKMVREALGTPAAKKVVVRIDRFVTVDADAIQFPLVVCRPFSGQGQIDVQISINWSSPLEKDGCADGGDPAHAPVLPDWGSTGPTADLPCDRTVQDLAQRAVPG